MELTSEDLAVQLNFPVCIAPQAASVGRPEKNGTRFILAQDGVYRELSTDWMVRTKRHSTCCLPYGEMAESLIFRVTAPPNELWRAFVEKARNVYPNECAGWFIWNPIAKYWRLAMRQELHASPDRIDYQEPPMSEDEVAVVDIHSHGQHRAYFSTMDDSDDAGGIKIAAVIGRVNSSQPEFGMRLVAIDEFLPLTLTVEGHFAERQS
jgi:PRTRC genetic system protein A